MPDQIVSANAKPTDAGGSPSSVPETLREVTEHVMLVTCAFLIIFAVAIGLHWLIYLLIARGIIEHQTPLDWVLIGAKYVLLAGDVALLFGLIWKKLVRAINKF